MEKKLIRVSQANENNLPFRSSTLYGWMHRKKHLQLFRKVGKSLFVDLEELQKLMDSGKVN